MSQLQTNDLVLTMNPQSGQFGFSPIIMWLDRDEQGEELFVELRTKSNRVIRLTSSHLIYVSEDQPIDLKAQQQQQQGMLSSNTGSGDNNQNNNNNYYYYYNTQNNDHNSAAIGDETIVNNNASATTTNVPITNNVNQLPNDSNPLLTELPPTMSVDDVAFTTYARNAIVGQYLLVSAIGESGPQRADFIDSSKLPASYSLLDGGLPSEMEFAPLALGAGLADDVGSKTSDQSAGEWTRTNSRLVFKREQPNENLAWTEDEDDGDDNRRLQDDVQRAGNLALQITSGHSRVFFDQIVSVNYVTRKGIYAPLTREGNIVVNSVVASCYALISDHDLAHMSFAPVRWLSYLNEWIIGLKPQTPLSQRTLEAINRMGSSTTSTTILNTSSTTQLDTQTKLSTSTIITNSEPTATSKDINTFYANDDSVERTPSASREINWYASMLYSIARFILPIRYMY